MISIFLQAISLQHRLMLYAVLFTDNPERAAVRRQLMPAHLAFLENHRDCIRAAGPLLEADGAGAGGLWLVEEEGHQAVDELVKDDPFWPTGLRQSVRIFRWTQVLAEGRRLIGG